LLCVTVGPDGQVVPDSDGHYTVGSPPIFDPGTNTPTSAAAASTGTANAATIPVFSSRPGAPASVYLNFGGDNVASWLSYRPGAIPAFSGSSTTMEEIWQIVAENYSPFNINVTTVQPKSGEVSQIDVGGNGSDRARRRAVSRPLLPRISQPPVGSGGLWTTCSGDWFVAPWGG
jgi:hypothetical protein